MKFAAVILVLLLWGAVSATPVTADENILWVEEFDGDLSGDRLNPTTFDLLPGINVLAATTGFSTFEDQEYFTIKVPAGHRWTQLILREYRGQDPLSFIGVVNGETFPFSPDEAQSHLGDLLGWAHFGPDAGHSDGDDILPEMGQGFGAIGFTPPLAGPAYTFWIQQFNTDTNYVLEFVAAEVPEPATWMLGVAVGAFCSSGRAKGRR